MHSIPFEIPPPKNEADFERMCAQVYGVVFDDRMPKMNGRRGQVQGGVDVFVKQAGIGRVGIQCKKYTIKAVKWADVEEEVGKADVHKTPIKKLILATTAPNDAPLLKKVQALSDEREAKGLFSVEVEFWDDICNHIDRFPVLQDSYAPQSPGAAYHRQETVLGTLQELAMETGATLRSLASLPTARPDSTDRLISNQLDRTNELLKAGKYRDALEHLAVVGKDLGPFDAHQKARWHLQRGLSLWFARDNDQESSALFLKAFELFPDDERMAAANIRGLMMHTKLEEALAAGEAAVERFPGSQQVWFALANVRLLQGEALRMQDVPEDLQKEPDALQFIAQAELKAGNVEEAIRLSQDAAKSPASGFFIRATALQIAVECGSRFPVGAMVDALPKREESALRFAVDLFAPWHERLWSIQSESVSKVVTHLGFALLMLHRFSEALALAQEAEAHGHHGTEVVRIQITALAELGRDDEVLNLTASRLSEMNPSCLSVVGPVAAKMGNVALLERALAAARAWEPVDDETVELLAALRWDALSRISQQELAVKEILAAKVELGASLIAACVAARVLRRANRALEAEAVVERAKTLVPPGSSEGQRLMLAELLFNFEQFAEAGRLFEQLVTPGRLSAIHNRLLACHVKSRSRRKAKELLAGFPVEWIENEETRALAIELGQDAGDWAFLRPLVEAHVKKHPAHPGSWLFRVGVSLHSSSPAEFQNDLRTVPEFLDGPIRATAQLASLELRYGELERGMRRLYRMVRRNLDEPEALSAYLISVVAASANLPYMSEVLPAVAAGCCVSLRDEFGHVTRVVLDPSDVGDLPKREGYAASDSTYAVALAGAVVGQEVNLPALAFGETPRYTVVAIGSAYRQILQVVHERAHALGGLPNMKMMHLGKDGDDQIDLTQMKAEVMRSSEVSRRLFEAYGKGHMTLSGFTEARGRSAVEAVLGWPSEGPPIFVGAGMAEEREIALELLARKDAVYVVDALTIAELVRLEVQEVLGHLPRVIVSPVTKGKLEERLREVEVDRSVATSTEVDGELAIIEHDATFHKRRLEFFQAAVAAVEKYCEVVPAYGELETDEELPRLADVLQDEEMEVLLLARATDATLLTLDGRLRILLEVAAKVRGVWPQAVLMHCGNKGLLDRVKVMQATVRQFLSNRSFVSLGDADLTWMVLQGGAYLQLGMRRFKTYLASDAIDFPSATSVAFSFLRQLGKLRVHLGAFGEIFEHVLEAALRHKQCPKDFDAQVAAFVVEMTDELNPGAFHLYGGVNAIPLQRAKLHQQYLAGRYKRAKQRTSEPALDRSIAVRVLFCSVIPWVVEDKAKQQAEAAAEELNASRGEQVAEARSDKDVNIDGDSGSTEAV
ncbi:tetratricopeptide (TPR) repeat protein [Variovorax boronicumulans]|uniref:PIN domain-containing protein n=1 Tax=Variovorax boronicumulans TaxID=436515 RepID=UPI00247525F6|nr:hypothetical protein [Variovorax boronicumulans]MDH6167611.1 tetratricopeptide (TPR) repeat protein [Variovorax boronicumulans]